MLKSYFASAFFLLLSSMTVPTQAQFLGGSSSSAPSVASKLQVLPSKESDLDSQRILESLALQSGWFKDLKIQVQDGMVTLSGKVDNREHAGWLTANAEKLPAVLSVINKAEVTDSADLSNVVTAGQKIVAGVEKHLPKIIFAIVVLLAFFFLNGYVNSGVRGLLGRKV